MPTPEPQVRFVRHPVDGPITGRFGETYTIDGRAWQHRGVDYGVPVGTPVWAPAQGRSVPFANDGSFGTAVCLEHADGWFTLYAHLSRAAVPPGRVLMPGDLIGYSGATGFVTGPHLHWQLCASSAFPADIAFSRDPLRYFIDGGDEMTPEERELLLKLATVVCGPRTGADFQSAAEALAEVRRLTLQDSVILLGLAETQRWLAEHTHDAAGRAQWPGKPPF